MHWRKILYPFSLLYSGVTWIRNLAFDRALIKEQEFDTPIITIGNLSTGGTGKTPMTEFLISHLLPKKIGLVSRGYGRKTKGLVLAHKNHRYFEIGDEPYQMFHKYPEIQLALSEKRVEGIQALLEKSKVDVVLLDDAFQHRHVKGKFQILLTTYDQPFYRDLVLPAGNLRESKTGKKRAQMIVVTKCPDDLSRSEAVKIKAQIRPTERQSIYFSGLNYSAPFNHLGASLKNDNQEIIVLTGIANPSTMLEHLKQGFIIKDHLNYPDHHNFSSSEIAKIEALCLTQEMPIVTTEKDWVRLKDGLSTEALNKTYYLPMSVKILFEEGQKLLNEVLKVIDQS